MRTEHRTGALVLLALLVWNPFANVYADAATESEGGKSGPVTETQTESSNASRKAEPGESDREETPAEPFIPSESVSADSAVSFPVDI